MLQKPSQMWIAVSIKHQYSNSCVQMSLSSYFLARHICMGPVCSQLVFSDRGNAVGSTFATFELPLFIREEVVAQGEAFKNKVSYSMHVDEFTHTIIADSQHAAVNTTEKSAFLRQAQVALCTQQCLHDVLGCHYG